MHVVVAGEGVIALSLAESLMNRHQVVYVGRASGEERLQRLDIETIFGELTSQEILRRARTAKADVFIACSANDEQNIVGCLAAARIGARRTVCILSRPAFWAPEGGETLAESLGIDLVIRPAEQLAEEIVRVIMAPGALDVRVFERGRAALLRYGVERDAPATQLPLKSLGLPGEVNLVIVSRKGAMIVPRGDTQLEPGDKVMVMGHRSALDRLAETFRASSRAPDERRATIIGAGTVGVAVARGLEQASWRVQIIDVNAERCEEVAGRLKSLVLHGDGADIELLEQEGVGDMPVLVAVTDNDEKNLLISLLAKHLGAGRIITRADRAANERMFEKVGIDVVHSAHGAAIRSITREIDQPQAEILAELEHGEACVIELELPPGFPPRKLQDLKPPAYAVVGSILRKDRLIVPQGADTLEAKDQALIFCLRADREKIHEYFTDVPMHRREVGVE